MTVTSYQAKKWVKGASQIVTGIILIIALFMLMDKLTSAPQEVQESAIIGFFIMSIVFVIVWCFVSATVSIIGGFIGKKQNFTLTEIAKRVDALESNLRSASLLPAAGTGPATGLSEEGGKRSSKKTKVLVAAVVAIIIVAAIAGGLVLFAFSGPPAAGASTPEQAFNTFVDRLNLKDANGAVGQTVWTLGSNRSNYVDQMDAMLSGFNHADITNGPHKILKNQLNGTEFAEMNARMDYLEGVYNIDIFDFVVLTFDLTVSTDNGSMTVAGRVPCVLIQDKWYLDVDRLFNGNDNGGNSITVTASKSGPSGGNWTVTVNGVTGTSSLSCSNVYIEVKNSTGIVVLQTHLNLMNPGTYYSGVEFQDAPGTGALNQDDTFVLDEAIYGPGSNLKLLDQPNGSVYLELTL